MAKSTLRLDTRRQLKDGTYPIQIVVGLGTNIYISTDIYSTIKDWDASNKLYTGKGGKRVNAALSSMLVAVASRILELKETGQWERLNRAQIKQLLTNLDLQAPTVGMLSLADVFEKMAEGRRENTNRSIPAIKKRLTAFYGDPSTIFFDAITRTWLEDFSRSLSDLSANSRAEYLGKIRHAVNWAIDHDIIKSNPFRGFKIKREETRMRDLPLAKFRTLMELPLGGKDVLFRDVYLLTFYLIGINTVDLSELTEENVVNGRIEYRRAKTGKLYSIKIEPEAQKILDKYKGKKHLLSWFDNESSYHVLQHAVNAALGKMGPVGAGANGKAHKMQPIEKSLTLYWARYSWATYAAELDIPKDTISEALGHTHGAKVTGVYIKYNRDKVDAANRKVIDYALGK